MIFFRLTLVLLVAAAMLPFVLVFLFFSFFVALPFFIVSEGLEEGLGSAGRQGETLRSDLNRILTYIKTGIL